MTDGLEPIERLFTRSKPHHRTPNLIGQRFGRLLVENFAGGDGKKGWWSARCDCGTTKLFVGSEMRKGKTLSCGCYAKERSAERATKHGLSRHKLYAVWSNMLDRCLLPSHFAYERYGGRGITVCDRWMKFEQFYSDMGHTWRDGLTLERKDNNAGYSPTNCAWVDRKAQARNKRNNTYIDTPKGRMLLVEAADISGINITTLCYRAGAGWPAKYMFLPPDCSRKVVG